MNGVLCKGTYEQMGEIVYDILQQHGCDVSCDGVTTALVEAYTRNADAGEIRPTCPDLALVLKRLKEQNKKLAVVTTDNLHITRKCLETLGIAELFDRVYTDDGQTPTKPDPYCIYDFCEFAKVEKNRVVMVGDTMTDVDFAKNADVPVADYCCCCTLRNRFLPSLLQSHCQGRGFEGDGLKYYVHGMGDFFTVIIFRDYSVLTPFSLICAAVVVICGIFAATDMKTLFTKRKNN